MPLLSQGVDAAVLNVQIVPIAIQLAKADAAVATLSAGAAAAAKGPAAALVRMQLKREFKRAQEMSRVASEQSEANSAQCLDWILRINAHTLVPAEKDGKPAQIGYYHVQALRRTAGGAAASSAPVVEFECWKRFKDFRELHALLKHHCSEGGFKLLNGPGLLTGLFPLGGPVWADHHSDSYLDSRTAKLNLWLAHVSAQRVRAGVLGILRDFAREGHGRNAPIQYGVWQTTATIVANMRHELDMELAKAQR